MLPHWKKFVAVARDNKMFQQQLEIKDGLSEEEVASEVRDKHAHFAREYLVMHEIARREGIISADTPTISKEELLEKIVLRLRNYVELAVPTKDKPREEANVIRVSDD